MMGDFTTSFSHPAFEGWIGIARQDITPSPSIYARNWGASKTDLADGVHRPLTLTALVLKADPTGAPFVLIALDGSWWKTHEDEWLVRGGLIESLSLESANVIVNLSHTHAGPSLCRLDKDKPGGHLVASYLESLKEAAIKAAQTAIRSCVPATLTWNEGACGLAQNRSFPDPERDRILCGFNPRLKADDTLIVGRVTDGGGRAISTLINYACHPTTLAWENGLLSTDFVGAMRQVVEENTGGAPCLFLQGASGDLAPREQYGGDTELADRHGRHLGYAALAILEGMLPAGTRLAYAGAVESGAPLASWRHMAAKPSAVLASAVINVEFVLKEIPTLEEIDRELALCQDRVVAERLRRKREVRWVVGNAETCSVPLWLWRVGDAFLVGQANEAFSVFQIELRRRFAPSTVVVMNLVNGGEAGYLPSGDLYDLDMYEVNQTPFSRGSLERLLDSATEALKRLRSNFA
jgi:hypothetical protein